ncbi:MlaC/ttg2D family ABC transporter substrate-binding protein [Hyphococcus sp.]|uniref:MlaC/ttg2D family ABC transporter substrate-binding protein n=1 Tax=Hyphococcus sp. TaxID=2038636 RepID=UPI0035C6EA8B
MFMSRVRIFAALIAAASATPVAAAQDPEPAAEAEESAVDGAVAFAKALTADATVALTSEKSEAEQLTDFQAVLADGMALDVIGKFMIGEARKTMSDDQLARYDAVFPDYLTKLYAEQFQDIVGRPLEVLEAKELGARDMIVRTKFDREEGSPIMVDWRVRNLRSGERKAIDIIVQGVSIMLVKREEFSSFIATNGVDALLDRLEEEAA